MGNSHSGAHGSGEAEGEVSEGGDALHRVGSKVCHCTHGHVLSLFSVAASVVGRPESDFIAHWQLGSVLFMRC